MHNCLGCFVLVRLHYMAPLDNTLCNRFCISGFSLPVKEGANSASPIIECIESNRNFAARRTSCLLDSSSVNAAGTACFVMLTVGGLRFTTFASFIPIAPRPRLFPYRIAVDRCGMMAAGWHVLTRVVSSESERFLTMVLLAERRVDSAGVIVVTMLVDICDSMAGVSRMVLRHCSAFMLTLKLLSFTRSVKVFIILLKTNAQPCGHVMKSCWSCFTPSIRFCQLLCSMVRRISSRASISGKLSKLGRWRVARTVRRELGGSDFVSGPRLMGDEGFEFSLWLGGG